MKYHFAACVIPLSFWSNSATVFPTRSPVSLSLRRSSWPGAEVSPLLLPLLPLPPSPLPQHRSWGDQRAGPGRPPAWSRRETPRSPRSGFCARHCSSSRSSRGPRTPRSPRGRRARRCSSWPRVRKPRPARPIRRTPPPSTLGSPGSLPCTEPSGRKLGWGCVWRLQRETGNSYWLIKHQAITINCWLILLHAGCDAVLTTVSLLDVTSLKSLFCTCGTYSYLSGLSKTGQVTLSVMRATLAPPSVIHSILLAVLSSRVRLNQSETGREIMALQTVLICFMNPFNGF